MPSTTKPEPAALTVPQGARWDYAVYADEWNAMEQMQLRVMLAARGADQERGPGGAARPALRNRDVVALHKWWTTELQEKTAPLFPEHAGYRAAVKNWKNIAGDMAKRAQSLMSAAADAHFPQAALFWQELRKLAQHITAANVDFTPKRKPSQWMPPLTPDELAKAFDRFLAHKRPVLPSGWVVAAVLFGLLAFERR